MAMTTLKRKGSRLASLISPSSINGAALRGTSLIEEAFTTVQATSDIRRLHTSLKAPFPSYLERFLLANVDNLKEFWSTTQSQQRRSFSVQISSVAQPFQIPSSKGQQPVGYWNLKASYASKATAAGDPTESVKELYDKISKSVEVETMPPNAWLWLLIEKCANQNDIDLLFKTLQNLRRFRLSNLRIHANFNCTLCLRVAEACARVGAIDFGKKLLWQHNVYGLTPSIGSANCLLLYAKKQYDTKLMVEIMKLIKRNHLPLQPSTADIVFSICRQTNNWELISKYSKKFIKAGVKLRRTTFATWMEFAAEIGDVESLWKIEDLRSDLTKQHTVSSSFSCAKGFLLEGKPENAAAIIHVIHQNLPDTKKADIAVELHKLVSEWPSEVIKHQKEQDRKALTSSLRNNIQLMIDGLSKIGLNVTVDLNETATKEPIPS